MGKDAKENFINVLMAFEDLMKPIWEERFNPNEAKKTELTR
jgi:hypothetical protein